MSLWISLYLPNHSLDVLFPQWPTSTPLAAVLHKEQVCALTPGAQALGVLLGMRRNTVLGLAPLTLLQNQNPAYEQKNLQQVALSLLQYTPDIAFINAHALVLDVTASLILFKGPRNLWRLIQATLQGQASRVFLGMAPTAQGAWVLACQTQTRQRRVLQKTTLKRKLDPLALHVLPAAQSYLGWFKGIGCQTLGQLRRLPRKGIQQRCEPALVQALDAAYGDTDEHFVWFEAPDAFFQRYDTLQRLEHTHAIFAVAKTLVQQMCGWLQARHYATSTLLFLLHHEKGRHVRPPTPLAITLSQACWLLDDFLTVLNEQLHTLVLNAPVIAISLSVSAVQPRAGQSHSLFPEPEQAAKQERRLLDLLRARLGEQQVLYPQPCANHLPEQANLWLGLTGTEGSASLAPANTLKEPAPNQVRPFWLLPSPLPLNTQGNRPSYKGMALRLLQGPERIESGWWTESGHEQRDYFIAQDTHAARYWVYRQRNSLAACWFLHGFFG